jgi:hypothetical protein
MNAWILYMWFAGASGGYTLTVVDQLESKEVCESLLADIKSSQPVHFAFTRGACKPYRMAGKEQR